MDKGYFYWIKLRTDFFDSDAIDFLLSQKNGAEYVVLYQMLCLKSANSNGFLGAKIGEIIIPYDINRIVRDTKYFDHDTVAVALECFKKLGLVYQSDENGLYIVGLEDMVGHERNTSEANRIRKYRKNKALQQALQNVTGSVTNSNVEKEIEKEKDIEIEKEKEKKQKKKAYGEYSNVKLTDDEYNRLCNDYGQEQTRKAIDFLDAYIKEKGYKTKDHNLTLRRWVFKAVNENNTNAVDEKKTNRVAKTQNGTFDMLKDWSVSE